MASFLRAVDITSAGGAVIRAVCSLGISMASLHVTGPRWADSAAAAGIAAAIAP